MSEEELTSLEINEMQVLLAEKRTSFALLRTGIAVFSLPLSVITVLIATSRYYNLDDIFALFSLLMAVCMLLLGLGIILIARSMIRIFWYDKKIEELRSRDAVLKEIIH